MNSYFLGLFFIFLVSIIWTFASVLVQHIFREYDFDSPFLLTYIGTSLFLIFLPTRFIWEFFSSLHSSCCGKRDIRSSKFVESRRIPWRSGYSLPSEGVADVQERVGLTSSTMGVSKGALEQNDILLVNYHQDDNNDGNVILSPPPDPSYSSTNNNTYEEIACLTSTEQAYNKSLLDTDSPDNKINNEKSKKPFEQHDILLINYQKDESDGQSVTLSPPPDSLSYAIDNNHDNEINETTTINDESFILGHYETILISMKIAPVWFLSNYTYNISLRDTTIASSTILASTGSFFAFLFSVAVRDESFTCLKFIGVVTCIAGSITTGVSDSKNVATLSLDDDVVNNNGNDTMIIGDIAGLLSAVGYGAYTVMIHKLCPANESHISMQLLFGYIGLTNFILLSPIVIYMQLSSYNSNDETLIPLVSGTVLLWLIVKGLFDNVLSDYLWARAVILTSATVASVGVGLTIPLAFLSDWWVSGIEPTILSSFGAIGVLVGFILVNLES